MAVKSEVKIYCQGRIRSVLIIEASLQTCWSMCGRWGVCESEWVSECEGKQALPKATKEPWFQPVFRPSWFTDALQISSATFYIRSIVFLSEVLCHVLRFVVCVSALRVILNVGDRLGPVPFLLCWTLNNRMQNLFSHSGDNKKS